MLLRFVVVWLVGLKIPRSRVGLTSLRIARAEAQATMMLPPGSPFWFVFGETILCLRTVSLICVDRFNSNAGARRIDSVDQIDFSAVDVAVDVDVDFGGAWR